MGTRNRTCGIQVRRPRLYEQVLQAKPMMGPRQWATRGFRALSARVAGDIDLTGSSFRRG